MGRRQGRTTIGRLYVAYAAHRVERGIAWVALGTMSGFEGVIA